MVDLMLRLRSKGGEGPQLFTCHPVTFEGMQLGKVNPNFGTNASVEKYCHVGIQFVSHLVTKLLVLSAILDTLLAASALVVAKRAALLLSRSSGV